LSQKNGGVSFSLAFGQFAKPVSLFHWDGLAWTADIVALRIMWLAFAVGIVAVSALFFDRFDSSHGRKLRGTEDSPRESMLEENIPRVESTAATLTPLAAGQMHSRFLAMVTAELRLMLKGLKWWWYVGAIGLVIASAAIPSAEGRGVALAFAWIWPVLLWSSMGVRETRDQTYQLIFSAPHPIARQLPAVWLAGVLVALICGAGFGSRLLLSGNARGTMAWLIGALFIPAAALALGVWSGSGKPFEILFTLFWYIGPLHAMPPLDFMGSAPVTATTHYPLVYLALTGVFILTAFAGRKHQLRS
jgi:hypothetical protein